MHFVDHINLKTPSSRRIHGVFEQLAHFVDFGIRCRVDFQEIDETPGVDLGTGRADAARRRGDAVLAIERFGQDTRQRRLADAARTGEQVGVVIDNLTLQETSIPGRYHYRLALTQPAKKRELFRGQVQIKVEGSLGDKPKTLGSRELGMKVGEGRYALRYFQLLEGNWQLPEGFIPDRVRVTIGKEGRQPAQELLAEWGDVIKPLVVAPSAPAAQ